MTLSTPNYQAAQFWFNVAQFIFTAAVAWYVRRVAKQKATEKRFEKIEDEVSGLPGKDDLKDLEAKICDNCNRHKKRMDAVQVYAEAVEKRAASIELQTAKLKIELDHMPTQQQFDDLNKSISGLSSELQKTQGRMEGINRAVDLINEFLINQGAKG